MVSDFTTRSSRKERKDVTLIPTVETKTFGVNEA
jgi:hypothetical protein